MLFDVLNTKSMQLLEKALDGTSLRNNVISNNIANVDTPGFKRSNVLFEDELKKALSEEGIQGKRTDPRHIAIGRQDLTRVAPETRLDDTTSYRLDGNNVDIDSEMAQLAKNTIMYEALAQKISGEFSKLRYVITEGRR